MANTIYQATFLVPDSTSIDSTSDNTFTCIVDGSEIDSYKLIIYDRDTNAILYNPGTVVLGSPLFNGDTLEMEVLAGTIIGGNGQLCKWTVEYFNGAESVVSYETPFNTSTTAVLSITVPATVLAQEFEFVGIYTQAENVALQQWYYVLYDENEIEIERSPISFSGDIRYTFGGFINGSTQKIRGFLITQANEQIESPLYTFTVSYSVPILDIVPAAIVQDETTSVLVAWGGISQVSGVITAGTSEYILDFLYAGNYGLHLDSAGVLKYLVDQPQGSTYQQVWVPDEVTFIGKIFKRFHSVSGDFYEVGYTTGRFYYNINGTTTYTLPYSLVGNGFILVARPQGLHVTQFTL